MQPTRNNHYVPQWYQRGFLAGGNNSLQYLDLTPGTKTLSDGRVITYNSRKSNPTSRCFVQEDLYTTFFGSYINDDVEKFLFGEIDTKGSTAVKAFIEGDQAACHHNFKEFFLYIDAQKLRTPKGLDWIKSSYPELNQVQLMVEMQALSNMNCTIWTEGVREIVSAKSASCKFIISDHPVTTYNYALPPEHSLCAYPNDPSISLIGTQTIFPLDREHCLILTNLEYAQNPLNADPLKKRTNARNFGHSLVRTDAFIRKRELTDEEVRKINFILKSRARRYIAAPDKEWLLPEIQETPAWRDLRDVLLPPRNGLFGFGGEMYVRYKDGSTYYQDAFGRTTPENVHLKKAKGKGKTGANDPCDCGSGKKFKFCCRSKKASERPSSDEISIRERNIIFYRGLLDILGLKSGKTWLDVRKELSEEQVRRIHELHSVLWPIHTDINSLLPRRSNVTRAVYTGIIDPRAIPNTFATLPLYFDEILVQNPFINPGANKPEFDPTKNPKSFKQDTLKNVALFLMLYPFIESGFVTFFPDPAFLNAHLRTQAWAMATTRNKHREMTKEERGQLEKLGMDDMKRMRYMMPREVRREEIRKFDPKLSEAEIVDILEYQEAERLADPLSLLQDNLYEEGAQFIVSNMTPNFELTVYLAQITGSAVITDSLYRWSEVLEAQHREDGMVRTEWAQLAQQIGSLKLPAVSDPEIIGLLRGAGRLSGMRKCVSQLGQLFLNPEQRDSAAVGEALWKNFQAGLSQAEKELANPKDARGRAIDGVAEYSHHIQLSFVAPKGGVYESNVQRLLVSSGSTTHMSNVPIAFFVQRAE